MSCNYHTACLKTSLLSHLPCLNKADWLIDWFISVRTCYKKALEHDQLRWIKCVIKQQQDNPPPRKLPAFGPPSSRNFRCPLWREGGEWILSGTTQWKSGQVESTFWVYTLLRQIAKPASQFCWNLANLLSDSYSKRTASANFDFFFHFGDIGIFSTGNANDLLSLTSSVCL